MQYEPTTFRSNIPKTLLIIGAIVILAILTWRFLPFGSNLRTSVLRTSSEKENATAFNFEIPEAGMLSITAGPTNSSGDATVFSVLIELKNASPEKSVAPFQIDPPFVEVINQKNPNNLREVALALVFPEGYLSPKNRVIARLPFRATDEGFFRIKSIFLGSLPDDSFPPKQEFPIFIDSDQIGFSPTGAKIVEVSAAQCADGIDNDGNGEKDYPDDKGCESVIDDDESSAFLSQCEDGEDNDGDGQIDYPSDNGCDSKSDDDETDPAASEALMLDISDEYIQTIVSPEGALIYLAIPPTAQELLSYSFQFSAKGGNGSYVWGVKGKNADSSGNTFLDSSGMTFSSSGLLSAGPTDLKAGNNQYSFVLTDGDQVLNFSVQMIVYDGFGNPVGLAITSDFSGSEFFCEVGVLCEAHFVAEGGIDPISFSFTSDNPNFNTFFQNSLDGPFILFTPGSEDVGVYNVTISGTDSSSSSVSAELSFSMTVTDVSAGAAPDIESSFVFQPEEGPIECEFLDISESNENYASTQFTCENGIMQGFEKRFRPVDSLNRAEAAKVTALIMANTEIVDEIFVPFDNLSETIPVNYNDVTVGDWFARFVYFLFQRGVIVDNVNYRPADTLNIAEALKMIIEAYSAISPDLRSDLNAITNSREWYSSYVRIARRLDASMAYISVSAPAKRGDIADLLYRLFQAYPVDKFKG